MQLQKLQNKDKRIQCQ